MKVKTYRAPTLAEALAEVKSDLGLDAVILQTRRLRHGGFLGMMTNEVVEVTAAVDPEAVRGKSAPAPARQSTLQEPTEDAKMMAVHWELANMRKTLETALLPCRPTRALPPRLPQLEPTSHN